MRSTSYQMLAIVCKAQKPATTSGTSRPALPASASTGGATIRSKRSTFTLRSLYSRGSRAVRDRRIASCRRRRYRTRKITGITLALGLSLASSSFPVFEIALQRYTPKLKSCPSFFYNLSLTVILKRSNRRKSARSVIPNSTTKSAI